MMKMVPASRRVTDASLDPPSSKRSRPIRPPAETVAGCASMATGQEFREAARGDAAGFRRINYSLRLGWVAHPAEALPAPGLVQVNVEFVGALAANQCQFERRTFRFRTRRHALQLEREA